MTGASAGIGRAIALDRAREGVLLAITGPRMEALAQVAGEIATASGSHPVVVFLASPRASYITGP